MAENPPNPENATDGYESRMWFVNEDPEATTNWKQQKIDTTLPLLDLNDLWGNISAAPDTENAEKHTFALCQELQQYMWSQTIPEKIRSPTKKSSPDLSFLSPAERVAALESREEENDDDIAENDSSDRVKTFGEPYLFKLRCENKKPKKSVPEQTLEEQAHFLRDILSRLQDIQKDHPHLFPVVISAFGFEMTHFFYAKLLEALEINNKDIIQTCRSVLFLIGDHANAKEMHLIMKTTVAKIDTANYEGSAFYTMCDLMETWGRIVKRLEKNRAVCIHDLVAVQNKMLPCVEGFISSLGIEEEAEDPGGLKQRFPTIVIRNISGLLQAQEDQFDRDIHLQDAVRRNGELVKSRIVSARRTADGVKYLEVTEKDVEKKDSNLQLSETASVRTPEDGVIDDWILERRFLLVWALNISRFILRYLPCPEIDKKKPVLRTPRETNCAFVKNMTERLDALANIFVRLGWTNPLRAAQLADLFLQLESVRRAPPALSGDGLGPKLQFCKNTKTTSYSISAFAAYLFLALRVKSSSGKTGLFDMSLKGSGFDLVDPTYAFEVALPYIMNLVNNGSPPISLIGVRIAEMFIGRIDRSWNTADVLRLRCGTSSMGVDVSVYGFLGNLGKVLESLVDPGHVVLAYGTLKKCITKIECVTMRFSVMTMLLMAAGRTAIAAQYVTCLKDVLDYANKKLSMAEDKEPWLLLSDQLRTRFVETVFPKYFSPRKDYLSLIDPVVATCSAAYFLAISDKLWAANGKEDPKWITPGLARRRKFCMEYIEVGRECLRAIAAASEYDIKSIPTAKKTKNSTKKKIFEAATVSLNHSVSSIQTLDGTLGLLKEMELQS